MNSLFRCARSLFVFAPIALCAIGATARADSVLYSNGAPAGGPSLGWTIDSGFQVENSFALSSAATLTGVTFGNDLFVGDAGVSVDWALVGAEGNQTPVCPTCSGTALLTPDGLYSTAFSSITGVNQFFSLPEIDLPAGTYWLELQNEVTVGEFGGVGGWDINGGPSAVWESELGDIDTANCPADIANPLGDCSSAFTIFGTPDAVTPTPEPASVALLGTGIAFLCAERRRRRNKLR